MELKNSYIKLENKELLLRHQLNTAYYWQEKVGDEPSKTGDEQIPDKPDSVPEKWSLLNNIDLHDWQTDCKKKWFETECRGVVKVVTGAGKTVLALAIAQELQNAINPDLRVAVVVPTIVLMGQWYEALIRHGNLPAEFIGRMGGGFQDDFSDNKRILICVLDSASTQLAKKTAKLNIEKSLFLIVDECHRAGASKMSNVFSVQRAYSLGLSATPERNDVSDPEDSDAEEKESEYQFEDTVIGQELGTIVYELNFAQAIEKGILPKFEIRHYGLPLQPKEKGIYEKLSRDITELRQILQDKAKHLNGGALVGWARKIAARGTPFSKQAGEYVRLTTRRKQLLYHARSREEAVIKILQKEFDEDSETRAILFHESVDEVMRLFQILRMKGFPVVAENSKLTDSIRAESIELFRKGIARVLVSAKSLIEGFDVPAADVGIVVASSSSVRQRIQTLGRILRKKDEGKKNAVLHVLYMAHTTDEFIYEKNDWEDVVGADKNLYYIWDPAVDKEPAPKTEPPRRPLPKEIQIDLTALKPGDIYPGKYDEGEEYSCDSRGNVFNSQKRLISNPQDVGEKVRSVKGDFGKFRVTHIKRAVLVLVKEQDSWITRFTGILEHPFEFREDKVTDEKIDVSSLKPGDIYPGSSLEKSEYRLKQRSGGIIIAKKVKGGENYARIGENADDSVMGKDAEKLIAAVREASKKEKNQISKFFINEFNHAIYLAESKVHFLCALEKGFEFSKEKGEI